ncbi:MAG: CBU_0592 family membrane protein [Steroidobacteraceae bacterium]
MKYAVEAIGWTAAAMMLSAYILLTMGRLSARSNLYHWLNVLSGAGFIVNSGWNGAYPSQRTIKRRTGARCYATDLSDVEERFCR